MDRVKDKVVIKKRVKSVRIDMVTPVDHKFESHYNKKP